VSSNCPTKLPGDERSNEEKQKEKEKEREREREKQRKDNLERLVAFVPFYRLSSI
jgi:hypothetical protein